MSRVTRFCERYGAAGAMRSAIGIVYMGDNIVLYIWSENRQHLIGLQLDARTAKTLGEGLTTAAKNRPDSQPGNIPMDELHDALRSRGLI